MSCFIVVVLEMVSPQPDSEVTVIFTDTSSPSVEIQLTELTSSQVLSYTFFTVELLSSGHIGVTVVLFT